MQVIFAIGIGLIGGVVAALCGVGGGVVMVPAFRKLLEMDQKTAVATSLAAIMFTSLATSLTNHRNGFIDWKTALLAGCAGALIGRYAADWLKRFQDVTLVRIFATIIILFGIQMWAQSLKKPSLPEGEKAALLNNHQKN